MRLPDFVILGAMKAGSTSLFRWLEEHPRVTLPAEKEPAFYSTEERWQRGLEAYAMLFRDVPLGQITGEASVHYSDPAVAERAARRLYTVAPETKLLFLVRDPVERLRSHYRHQVQRGRERRPMLDALTEPDSPYERCSMYARGLAPWLARFGRERFLVLDFERLVAPSDEAWQRVLKHLELPPIPRPDGAHNVTSDKRSYSGLMRRAYDLGLARYEKRIPRLVRSALKPLAFRANHANDALVESSKRDLPIELRQRLDESLATLVSQVGSLT